ncbi:MAG: DUF1653 domain-containing protein [Lachnospiraceae bacterium]|nr:DUF1653 domain-containing protein [Lachnospiraceae bacterium]
MRADPKPQEMYRHFKGNIYQIRCLAKHSETREMMVVYQAMYDTFQIYVRPLDMFMEEVDHVKYPDVKQKYRFELLQDIRDMEMTSTVQTQNHDAERDAVLPRTHAQEDEAAQSQTHVQEENAAQPQTHIQEENVAQPQTHVQEETVTQPCIQTEESDEQVYIDPLVMEFLDADTYEQRLNVLAALRHRITDDMINTMAVAVDLEIKDGNIEERYEELKNCLLTFEKYECNRLR